MAQPPLGYYVPRETLEAVHAYLMARPGNDTADGKNTVFDLVVAVRSATPLTREPKR